MPAFSFFTLFWMNLLCPTADIQQQNFSPAKKDLFDVAFYNVENLFDTVDNPHTFDEEFTPGGDNHWNTERLNKKLDHLSRVICAINEGGLPEVIGLCEVENGDVTRMLATHPSLKGARYEVIQYESPDARGIDVALMYNRKKVKVLNSFADRVELRDTSEHTRDLLWVQAICNKKDTLWFCVAHFPSRREGEEASRHKRASAAMTVKRRSDSILAQHPMARILIMGDFNDEPMDSSVYHILGARNFSEQSDFYNAMMTFKEAGFGSYKYRGQWNMLDQMILSKGLVKAEKGLAYVPNSVLIFTPEWLKETDPKYAGSPFRTYAGKKYLGGYSDHFPVMLQLGKP